MMHRVFIPRFCRAIAILSLAALAEQGALAQSAPAEPFSRGAMLQDLSGKVISPAYQELALKSRELANSVGRLVKTPGLTTLADARRAWIDAWLTASRVRCFQAGPLTDRDYGPTFYYWQVLTNRIEGVLNSSRPIDGPLIDELGVTTKGLFALEYLLFDRAGGASDGNGKPPSALELLSGAGSKRRGEYLLAVAGDVEAKAGQLAKEWSAPGEQGARAKFAGGGQASLNLLVNQLAMAMEDITEHRLKLVLVLPGPISRQLNRIEGSPSGTSLQSVLATLEGLRKMYLGGEGFGLDEALKRVNPAVAKRVRDQFEATLAAARAINAPLEQAISGNRASVQNACEKARALEILFKVDLVSALGVTLTFSSNDGD